MAEKIVLFVGTYTRMGSKGIYTCKMDPETGELQESSVAEDIENPSFLALNSAGDRLYAVWEITERGREGGVSAYSINGDGSLTFLNRRSTGGAGPCHLAVDATDSYVIATNYAGGSVCMLPIGPSGALEERSDFVQHEGSSVDSDRQEQAHAHSVTIDNSNSRAYVCDLGTDKIIVYGIDRENGRLEEDSTLTVKAEAGQGPRHFDFHPGGDFAYVINELGSTVAVYDYDGGSGRLSEKQLVSALPDGWTGSSSTADVHVSPDGRFLYGSNRGHDSIAVFSIEEGTGELTPMGHEPTLGKTPRNFAISPDGGFLLAENQDTGNIVTFAIDRQSGRLEFTGGQIQIPAPVCIKFLA